MDQPVIANSRSRHFRARLAQRGLSEAQFVYVLTHGRVLQRAGGTWYILRRRDIPLEDQRYDVWARLAGVVVLLAADGTLVTVYRNAHPARHIEKKTKYERRPNRQVSLPRVA